MKTPAIIVCVLGCFLTLGCRLNPRITMLEQECRMHEDRIYALQDQLSMAQNALSDASQENLALRGEDGKQDAGSSRQSSSAKTQDSHTDAPTGVDVQLPGAGLQEVSPDALQNLTNPSESTTIEVEIDPNALPSLETPGTPPLKQDLDWGGKRDSAEPIPHGGPVDGDTKVKDGKVLYQQEGPQLRGDSREVKEITISEVMTGGVNADGQKGDEGVFVVVEPRDAKGRLVSAVGPISIIAYDPALPTDKARLAQWDFSEKEAAGQFRRSGSAEGFHLEVRWPDVPPRHEQLKLYVRYTTGDQRKLYAETPIRIALAPPRNTTLVARPAPRRLAKTDAQGWASKPKQSTTVTRDFVSAPLAPRVASASSHPIRQAIPPANEEPVYAKRPAARPRPVWSPVR